MQNNQPPTGDSFPWFPLGVVVVLVLTLSAFGATKKIAYWVGGLTLVALLLPPWRKAGYPTGLKK